MAKKLSRRGFLVLSGLAGALAGGVGTIVRLLSDNYSSDNNNNVIQASSETPAHNPTQISTQRATAQPTQTVQPTYAAPDKKWLSENSFPGDSFTGFTNYQKLMYMDEVNPDELHLIMETTPEIFSQKLTPDSISDLAFYLSNTPEHLRKSIMESPQSPFEMIDSSAYVLGLSRDMTPYWLAEASFIMKDVFGLDTKIVDNTDPKTGLYRTITEEYELLENGSLWAASLEPRLSRLILERDKSHKAMNDIDISDYVSEYGFPDVARYLNIGETFAGIEEAEKNNTGPITLYLLGHTHFGRDTFLSYEDGTDTHIKAKDFFPESFLNSVKDRHLNLIFSSCPAGFLKELEDELKYNEVSYTLLYSDNGDPDSRVPIEDMAEAMAAVVWGNGWGLDNTVHPAVNYQALQQLVEQKDKTYGRVNGENRVEGAYLDFQQHFDNEAISTFYFPVSKFFGEAAVHLQLDRTVTDYMSPLNAQYSPKIAGSIDTQARKYIPIFGLNLQKMKESDSILRPYR